MSWCYRHCYGGAGPRVRDQVVVLFFLNFHPDTWGNDPNLTSIFFRWVVQPPTSGAWFAGHSSHGKLSLLGLMTKMRITSRGYKYADMYEDVGTWLFYYSGCFVQQKVGKISSVSQPAWRIIPLSKLGSPPFISHEVRPFGRGPTTLSLGDENDSPWLLTTYPSPVMILQVDHWFKMFEQIHGISKVERYKLMTTLPETNQQVYPWKLVVSWETIRLPILFGIRIPDTDTPHVQGLWNEGILSTCEVGIHSNETVEFQAVRRINMHL